jgi:regulator of protease activity HflC (stomatin/prohibitin superfamily)
MNISVVTQGLVVMAWIAAIVGGVYVFLSASRERPVRGGGRVVLGLFILALFLTSVSSGLVFIQPEDRGVVISAVAPKGYREQALQPGLRWIIPFAETVVTYTISNQTYTMSIAPSEGQVEGDDSITARTADGQEILVDASVIYKIDPNRIVDVHILWQDRYTDDLVRPQARGVIRDIVSQYGVEQVVSSKRVEMTDEMSTELTKKFEENGLIMVDFILRNLTFSTEYAASVEQKQIAEQLAQQAKLTVEQKKQEAEQARQVAQGQADAVVIRAKADAEARLIAAEAEAKSLALISAALKDNPNLLNYQYINKLSPNLQVMLVPSNSPFLLPFPAEIQGTSTPAVTPTETPPTTTTP